MNRRLLIGGLAAALAITAGVLYLRPAADAPSAATPAPGAPIAAVAVPVSLTGIEKTGERVFNARCAACHGKNAAGQEGVAPPLIHRFYKPSHHGDEAFQRAAANGVRAHHWPFGDMPPVSGLTRGDVKLVIAYIRRLQVENRVF